MRPARQVAARVGWVAFEGALAGLAYSAATHGRPFAGVATGAVLGASLSFLEGVVFAIWARGWLNRLPFAVYFALRVAVYCAIVLVVILATAAATGGDMTVDRRDLLFALAVCVAMNLLFSVNELLGPGVLFAFAAGRYRRPRRERRALVYLDLCGSTGLAERLGEARFLDFLNAFFEDVTESLVAEGGEIHKYVGDEVIATWSEEADPARPIRAAFAARRRLAQRAPFYRESFAETPDFRAAIHAGPVVVGELGARKKEIALIGDAMNTAARVVEAARETGAHVLISAPYFERLRKATAGIVAAPLPPISLRGKSVPLALIRLEEERSPLAGGSTVD